MSEPRNESTYTCDHCKMTFSFDPGWSQADAFEEAKENGFGADLVAGDCARVCDDCYKQIMNHFGLLKNQP